MAIVSCVGWRLQEQELRNMADNMELRNVTDNRELRK